MPDPGFHFVHPEWLLALLAPVAVLLWLWLTAPREDNQRYRAYADPALLPMLLGRHQMPAARLWRRFLIWSLVWALTVLAAAGPRWDFHDVQLFRPGSDLVILLDLSSSMDINDVAPSRLARAHQEINDLIDRNQHSRIGLIVFASLAYVVSPLTEDASSLRLQLPALTTNLVKLKGSRLYEALIRARQMLAGQPEDSSRHLLLISDGDFADNTHLELVEQMASEGAHLHVLGIGTTQGGTVQGPRGRPLRHPDGSLVNSPLDDASLRQLAELGDGIYRHANFRDRDTRDLLQQIGKDSNAEVVNNQKTRVWNERYFWIVGLAMLFLLPGFRVARQLEDTP